MARKPIGFLHRAATRYREYKPEVEEMLNRGFSLTDALDWAPQWKETKREKEQKEIGLQKYGKFRYEKPAEFYEYLRG